MKVGTSIEISLKMHSVPIYSEESSGQENLAVPLFMIQFSQH